MADNVKHVLIVEDDDLICQMYQATLAGSGFDLQIVKDGELGWNAMQTTTPNIVILDFMLPKLNGLEILAKMRSDLRLKTVPAIVMSSLTSDADKKRAMDAGATAYWVKNEVNMVEFAALINKFMQ